jgi:IS5 family transposase
MNQTTFDTNRFELSINRLRNRESIEKMNLVVPLIELIGLSKSFAPAIKAGNTAFPVAVIFRIHFRQQCLSLFATDMAAALYNMPLFCEFTQLDAGSRHFRVESDIHRLCSLFEPNNFSTQILVIVNANFIYWTLTNKVRIVFCTTLIAELRSVENISAESDLEMSQTKKVSQYHFVMTAHLGGDFESRLFDIVAGTAANGYSRLAPICYSLETRLNIVLKRAKELAQ